MKRIRTFICNWVLIATLPIWGGVILAFFLFLDAYKGGAGKKVLTGKDPLITFDGIF